MIQLGYNLGVEPTVSARMAPFESNEPDMGVDVETLKPHVYLLGGIGGAVLGTLLGVVVGGARGAAAGAGAGALGGLGMGALIHLGGKVTPVAGRAGVSTVSAVGLRIFP